MTDTIRMLVWLRETLDAAQRDAEAVNALTWFAAGVDTRAKIQACFITPEDPAAIASYFERFAPATVLRRIDRDRKMLDEHADDGYGECKTCSVPDGTVEVNGVVYDMLAHAPAPCATVRLLAEAWGWTEETTS